MVVTGAIGFDDAVRAVDFRTLVLLFGMMVLVAHLRLAGGFAALARTWAAAPSPSSRPARRGSCSPPACCRRCSSTTPSAWSSRRSSLTSREHAGIGRCRICSRSLPRSNIGSAATITGNPQNMLIGSVSGVSFRAFSAALGPVAAVGLAIDAHRDLGGVPARAAHALDRRDRA